MKVRSRIPFRAVSVISSSKKAYLRLDVRLSLLQEFCHSHRPVLARPLTAHGPLTEQGHHSFIVGGDLRTKRNGYQPCPM